MMSVAIWKLLEMICRSAYACSITTALHSNINQTAGSGGHLSMWENRCMHATVRLCEQASRDGPAKRRNRPLLGFLSLSWTEWRDLPLVSNFSCFDGAALRLRSMIDCTGCMSPRESSSNCVLTRCCLHGSAPHHLHQFISPISVLPSRAHLRSSASGTLLFPDLPARLSASGHLPSPHPESGTLCHHHWNLMTAPR